MRKLTTIKESALDNALSFLDSATLLDMYAVGICDSRALAAAFQERMAFHYPEKYRQLLTAIENSPLRAVNWRREFIIALNKEFPLQSKEFKLKALSAREGRLDGLSDLTLQDFSIVKAPVYVDLPSQVPHLTHVAARNQHVLDYLFHFILDNDPERLPMSLSNYAICCKQTIDVVVRNNLRGNGTLDYEIGIDLLNFALDANNMDIAKVLVETFEIPVGVRFEDMMRPEQIPPLMRATLLNRIEFIECCANIQEIRDCDFNSWQEYSEFRGSFPLNMVHCGATLLDMALCLNHSEIVDILLVAGAEYNYPPRNVP